ncbi:MAG TPA: PKD domain-containing protein [Candidatus Binatia bacterium]|nr:PKD domain-containing protein [Candidatus Binatia bacterium]
MSRAVAEGCGGCLARRVAASLAVVLAVAGGVRADNRILYTTQANLPAPGVPPGVASYASDQTWAQDVCTSGAKAFPNGDELEWAPVLDPGKDAEINLVAVSGTTVYNPQPDESGYCRGAACPGQPISCSSSLDCFGVCGGFCDFAQGPSCAGGACPSPWTDPQVGSPIACVNDAQCAACGGVCAALGRSRGDLQATHPFGFDYDVAIAPDPDYLPLLSRGNVESTHLDPGDPTGETAQGGFEDIVYPYLHATTPADTTTNGWCSPDFKNRCASSADCGGNACEGVVNGLGLDPLALPGTLGMETDHDLIPDSYQPRDGDRVAVFGRWIVDCGHGDSAGFRGWHTEIHPPLLVASGRDTGDGFFGAHCSGEQTCTSVIGRPYLVSQNFGDGAFLRHLEHELEKLGCLEATGPIVSGVVDHEGYANLPDCSLGLDPTCVCNDDVGCIACEAASCAALDACIAGVPFACGAADPPLGLPCSTQIESRAHVDGVPFTGTQEMQYYVQPANGRLHPGDRMLVKWALTARSGVTVALSNGGDAGVLVDVTMDDGSYKKAALPSKQDWVIDPGEVYPSFSLGGLLDFAAFIVAPVQVAIVDRGLFSDRYQAPAAPANDTSPSISFADQLDGTAQAAQTIDDSQAFPVSGRINVGWFRCDAGGPYGAHCAGPQTSVTLDGSGSSDPDGNPLTYTWSGPFLGGSASGVTPTVKFSGGGTFPVTLTVSNGTVSTSCTSSVTIRPAAVLQLGGGNVNVTGDAGGIGGDVCVGPGGSLAVTGAQFVTGNIYLAAGDPLTKSGTGAIGPVLQNQDLSARIGDTLTAAADLAALPCTQTFARWNGPQVVVGAGGQNVICVGNVNLGGNDTVVLSGGANDTFVVKVAGKLKLTESGKIMASGVPPSAIVYDVVGSGQQVVLSSAGPGGASCCSASLDGTLLAAGRAVTFGPGLVNGEVISGQSISLGGGSSVR